MHSSRGEHGSQGKLGSSLSSLGGSVLANNYSLSSLRNEVHKILAQKQRTIDAFQAERVQDLIKVRIHHLIIGKQLGSPRKTSFNLRWFSDYYVLCFCIEIHGNE